MADPATSKSRLKPSSPAMAFHQARCRIDCLFDCQSAHEVKLVRPIGFFHFQQLIERPLRADAIAICTPRPIKVSARGSKQAERSCSHSSGEVHLTAVISDEQGAMLENGCGLQQVRAAGQVKEALRRDRRPNGRRECGFIRRAQDNHMCIFKRACRARKSRSKRSEILSRPAFGRIIGTRSEREQGSSFRQNSARIGAFLVRYPDFWGGRWRKAKNAGSLFDAMQADGLEPAVDFFTRHRAGNNGIAQIDHEIPALAGHFSPQIPPMEVPRPFLDRDDAIDIGNVGRQRQAGRTDRKSDPRLGVGFDNVAQKPARQNKISDPRIADEQNLQ